MNKIIEFLLVFSIMILCFSCKTKNIQCETNSERKERLESRANTLYYKDYYSESIKYWDSLIRIDSSNGEYYYKRAFSYGKTLKRDEATKDFKKAIQYNFKVAPSYFNMGISNNFYDDSLALFYYKKALEIDPNYLKAKDQMEECKSRLELKRTLNLQ